MTMSAVGTIMQVRQRLYNTSVGKWKQYEKHMQPAVDLLEPMVTRYEEEHAAYFPHQPVRDEL